MRKFLVARPFLILFFASLSILVLPGFILGGGVWEECKSAWYCSGTPGFPIVTIGSIDYYCHSDNIWSQKSDSSKSGYNQYASDCSAPATSDNAPTAWQSSDATVRLTCTDSGTGSSGCDKIYYCVYDLGGSCAGAYTSYTLPAGTSFVDVGVSCPAGQVCQKVVGYYSFDKYGYYESTKVSGTIKIDKVAPTTSDNAPTAWQSSDATVTLTCNDGTGSGCATTKYCIYDSGGAQCTPATTGTSASVTCADNSVCQKIVRYYSTDNAGNAESAHDSPIVKIDKHCELVSASIARSASCAFDTNNCANAGTSCKAGNSVAVTAAYKGLKCPSSFNVQVDASGGSCSVAGSGATMTGISMTCTNTPSADAQTCTGTWTLPTPVPPACQGITITASTAACGASINGLYCKQPSGSFGACKDMTNTIQTAITLNSGDTYSASKTVTATTLSGKDTTYSLSQCVLNWGDGSTTTKTCDAGANVECANKFSAAEKQHAYATNGAKSATFTCTNVNSVTGSSSDGITIDDTTPDIVAISAYTDSSKTTSISSGAWQADSTPYFTWTDPTSPSDNRFYYTYNSAPADPTGASSYTSNPYLDGLTFTDGTHMLKTKPWTFAGTFGTTRSFTLKVDTSAPTLALTGVSWTNVTASASPACTDAGSGCGAATCRLYSSPTQIVACPATYSSYVLSCPQAISSYQWLCAAQKDAVGLTGFSPPAEFSVDQVKPATTISKSGTLGDNGWYKTDVTATLSCSDAASGCASTKYRIDAGAWNTYSTPFTITTGTHTIDYYSTDVAGNIEIQQTGTVKVDKAVPSTTDNSDTNWHNSDVTITLTCSDAASGCASTKYCTDTAGTCAPSLSYSAPLTISLTSYARYQSTDNAGNAEGAKTSNQIKIDKDKPSSSVSALPARTKPAAGGFTVSWSGSDAVSGVKNYKIEYKDGATGVWTTCVSQLAPASVNFGPGCAMPVTLQDGHTYYFRSIAEDNAGNFENAPADYDAYTLVDMSAPTGFDVRADKEYLQWVAPSFRIYTPTAIAADDIVSCDYTTDGASWNAATWNSGTRVCEKTGLACSDGQALTLNMRVTDSIGNVGSGLSIVRVCDNSVPTIDTINPAFGQRIYVGSLNPGFTIFASDGKSGMNLTEWELFAKGKTETSYASKGVSRMPCEGTPGATVSCTFAPSNLMVGGVPYTLSNMDTAYVKVKTADRLDNWSPLTQSGEIVSNPSAPQISAIYPIFMKLGQAQKYSADAAPKEGLKVISCDLYVNNVLKGNMSQVSGDMVRGSGTWESASQTLTTPGVYFMRARCGDDGGNIGDGPETLISVGTSTTSAIKPASAEKYETINVNATYADNADSPNKITGATCSITDTNFTGPRTIKGKIFRELGNGIYTSSFEAPGKSGDYYYVVSCSKFGYQTTSDRKDFTALGCVGSQCIDVTPPESLMIFTVGETQTIDLVLRNRGDNTRTYSVALNGNTINIHTQISPAQLTIPAGQADVARITMTAVAFTSDQLLQNIAVTNVNDASDADISLVRVSIVLSSLPDVSIFGMVIVAVLASAALFFRKK